MWLQSLSHMVRGFGARGVFAFACLYVFGVLFLPASPLTIVAGVAYGLWGLPLALVSELIGASIAFFIARYFLRKRVEEYIERNPKSKALSKALEKEGWQVVFLARLSPVIPFLFQNYFFGTTPVGFGTYISATFVGILPGTAAYVYLGALGVSGSDGFGIKIGLFIVGLIATIWIFWSLRKKAKAILES